MSNSRSAATTRAPRARSASPATPGPAPASSATAPPQVERCPRRPGAGPAGRRRGRRRRPDLGHPGVRASGSRRRSPHSHRAPSSAARSHQSSSAGSPTAFSHAKTAAMPTRLSPSCRSHQPAGVDAVVLEPVAVAGDRGLLALREPGPVEGEVPGQVPARRRLAGVGPVEQDGPAVGAAADVAELPVARDEGERGGAQRLAAARRGRGGRP